MSNPEPYEVYYKSGIDNLSIGRAENDPSKFQNAASDFDEAIRLNPEYCEAYCNRGIAKIRLEKFQDAINDFNEVIRLNPELSATYITRGLAKSKLGDKEGALADFTKAKELNTELDITELQSDL